MDEWDSEGSHRSIKSALRLLVALKVFLICRCHLFAERPLSLYLTCLSLLACLVACSE